MRKGDGSRGGGRVLAPINLGERASTSLQLDTLLSKKRQTVSDMIRLRNASRLSAAANVVRQSGGNVVGDFLYLVNALNVELPRSSIYTLANHSLVSAIIYNPTPVEELNVSVPSYGFPVFWADSHTGGIWDLGIPEGVDVAHPSLSSHSSIVRPGTNVSSHGTYVTGIVSSTDPIYTGAAFGHELIVSARTSNTVAGLMEDMDWMTTAPDSPEVVNHSIGYGPVSEDYSLNEVFFDVYTEFKGVTVVKSAGNGGYSQGGPTITEPAGSYNIIVVSNVDDRGTETTIDDRLNPQSSTGPTIAGRNKPTIAAPGTGIASTSLHWTSGANFLNVSGTSMAAPHVAAVALLMLDDGLLRPAEQQALLYNTADAMNSNGTATTADDFPVAGDYWDAGYGYGLLDAAEASYNASDVHTMSLSANNNNDTPDDYRLYRGQLLDNEKVTAVWLKRHPTYVAGPAQTKGFELSDVDLHLYGAQNGAQIDESATTNQNVEQVTNRSGSSVDSVIKVSMYSDIIYGADHEQVALAAEENFSNSNPPAFSFKGPGSLNFDVIGSTRLFSICVTKHGEVPAHAVELSLIVSSNYEVNGSAAQLIGTVADSDESCHEFSVNLISDPSLGIETFEVRAISNSYDEIYAAAATVPVSTGAMCAGMIVDVNLNFGQSATSGPDVILGTAGPDIIIGLGGNDLICGGDGYDRIYGGSGSDTIYGGDGLGNDDSYNDLFGGSGNDYLYGANYSNDALYGQSGMDTLITNNTDARLQDKLYGGSGRDLLISNSAGGSEMRGLRADDEIYGSDAGDVIFGGPGQDIIYGNDGADTINGGLARDAIYGGNGNDLLAGAGHRDFLSGENGDDLLLGGLGNDTLDGGAHVNGDTCIGQGNDTSGSGDKSISCEFTTGFPRNAGITQAQRIIQPGRIVLSVQEVELLDRCNQSVDKCLQALK